MPLLTNNAAWIRTIIDGLSISATSTFESGNPATNVQHHRPRTVARSTDTSSGTPAYITFDMGGASIASAHEVWQYDVGTDTYVDQRDEFNSAATGDCSPWGASPVLNDAFYVGFPAPFESLSIDVGTAGVGSTMSVQYYNGTSFQGASGVTDNTVSLTALGVNTITWTAPSTWQRTTVNGGASLYFIKLVALGTYTTDPVLDEGSLVSELLDPVNLVACPMYASHDGAPGSLMWRLRFSANSDLSSPTYESGSGGTRFEHPWAGRDFAHAFLNPYDDDTTIAPSRYARFDFWSVDATYIDIGRIYLGKLFQPTVNIAYGSSTPNPREDPRRLSGTLGQQYSSAGRSYMATAGTMQFSTEAQAVQTFSELTAYRGTNRDLVYIHDPKTTAYLQQQLVYGRFDTLAPLTIPRMNFWGARYIFPEVR